MSLLIIVAVAALVIGVVVGRRSESSERRLRERLLDEADREIAAMGALERIHHRSA